MTLFGVVRTPGTVRTHRSRADVDDVDFKLAVWLPVGGHLADSFKLSSAGIYAADRARCQWLRAFVLTVPIE